MGFQEKNVETVNFKRSRFNYSHDVSTSAQFGEVQPTLCRLVATQGEHHTIKFNSICRMSPLINPLFGRVVMKYTTHFVPFSQIYPRWENTFSDIPNQFVAVGNNGYYETSSIPTKLPSLSNEVLMSILCRAEYSTFSSYGRLGQDQTNNNWSPMNSNQITDTYISNFFSSATNLNQFVGVANMQYWITYANQHSMNDLTPSSSDYCSIYYNQSLTYDCMLLLKLSSKGQRLVKVLQALGYKPSFNNSLQVSFLPLLAYFKAYFDQYAIQQFDLWQNTYAYKLIKWIEDHGTIELKCDGTNDNTLVSYVLGFFLDELSECWYVENPDFVSSCLDPAGYLSSVTNNDLNGLNYPSLADNLGYTVVDAGNKINGGGHGSENMNNGAVITTQSSSGNMDRYLDAISLKLLKQLYLNVQQDSAIGYSIAERLKSRGYGGFIKNAKKYFLGSKSQQINFSDVTSYSETQNAPLATTAAKGVGVVQNSSISFEADEMGYIIQLVTIYPISNYVNALDPTLLGLNKYTFYNARYDALSYEQVPFACVGHINGSEYSTSAVNDKNLFGFTPRYTGFKTKPSSLLNGNFSLRSVMNEFVGYTLDKLILSEFHNETDLQISSQNVTTFKTTDGVRYFNLPVAGRDWRVVANRYWKGNYNRIFYGSEPVYSVDDPQRGNISINDISPLPDRFLLNIEYDHHSYARMRPIEDSWNATDDEVKRNHDVDSVKQ